MIPRGLLLIAVAGLVQPLAAQEATPAVALWQKFMASPQSLLDLPSDERALQLSELGAALAEDPAGVADELERGGGGRRAVQAYAEAMIADGHLPTLVEQFHAVMQGGDMAVPLSVVLNQPQTQDGSVWFPQAEQAGFFAGGIAAVLDGVGAAHSDEAIEAIARRFDLPLPLEGDTASDWLLAGFTNEDSKLSVPAAQWFEKGFAKAYR